MKKIIITFSLILCCFSGGIAQPFEPFDLKTPHGSSVVGTIRIMSDGDVYYTVPEQQYIKDTTFSNYGGAKVIEYPNWWTNCHGYAWYTHENQHIKLRIYKQPQGVYPSPLHPSIFWLDYSYVEVPESMATRVYYHPDGDHSAVRLNSGWYISKWGLNGPLVEHLPNETPPLYQPSSSKKYFVRLALTGPNYVCSGSSTFSVQNATGLTWNQSSNLGRSGSGSSVSIYQSGSAGPGWVSINDGAKELARINVWVGGPTVTISGLTSVPVNSGTTFYATVSSNYTGPAITGYQWEMSPMHSNSLTDYGYYASAYFTAEDVYRVSCRAINACGAGPWADLYVTVGSRSPTTSYTVYPNPVRDILYIDIPPSVSSKANNPLDIRLYDMQGNLALHITTTQTGTVQIDVSHLRDGTYMLQIDDGVNTQPYSQAVVIRH